MTLRKQTALLLILICLFAACSERNSNLLVERDIPKEPAEGEAIGDPEKAKRTHPIEIESPKGTG